MGRKSGKADGKPPIAAPQSRAFGKSVSPLRVWETEINLAADAFLADHRLEGIPILPGAVFIEMGLATAARESGESSPLLEEVVFQKLLFLPESGVLPLQAVLSANEAGATLFRVQEPLDAARRPASEESIYASMTIHRWSSETAQPKMDETPFRHLPERSLTERAGDEFYADLAANGNWYGPAFRAIRRLWQGDGEAIAEISIPKPVALSAQPNALHTILLDAAFQTVLAAAGQQPRSAKLLAEIKRVWLQRPFENRLRAYARLLPVAQGEEQAICGDVCLLDETDNLVGQLLGIRFKYLAAENRVTPTLSIAVAATFTAIKVEDSLAFWMTELGWPHRIAFAPYNQPFQQLLDPASLLRENREGVNVILLRLEDWIRSDQTRAAVTESEKEELLAGHLRHLLAGEREIVHLNRYETEYLYEEIFRDRVYVKHGISLPPGACVLDVGANIGLFTLFVHQQVADARVYAFEPSPPVYEALQINTRLYGHGAQVFNCGLSDREGSAPFTFYRRSSVFSGFHADRERDAAVLKAIVQNALDQARTQNAGSVTGLAEELLEDRLESETFTCRLRKLSNVIREQQIERIDLLKIDAERSEQEILNGIDESDWQKIRQVVLEVHDESGATTAAIRSLLKSKGFAVVVDEEAGLAPAGFCNLYAVRRAEATQASNHKPLAATVEQQLARNLADVVRALHVAAQSATPHVLCVCPPSPAVMENEEQRALFRTMEQQLAAELSSLPAIHLIDSATLLSAYPIPDYSNTQGDQLGHVPYTNAMFAAIGTMVARKIYALRSEPFKVIAVDCDQTLWEGECGEVGPLGVTIDPPRRRLQEVLAQQSASGKLICLCSKNQEADVFAVFERHPNLRLHRSHLAAWRVNWQSKSKNLGALADELGVALDSFIFIDNDPVECAEVRANCPEVLTLQLPANAQDIPNFIEQVWAFDQLQRTDEDRQRVRHYQQNRERNAYLQKSLTLGEFLEGLDLQIGFSPIGVPHFARVSQLMLRTNQFNLTGVRRSVSELQEFLRSPTAEGIVVEVSDRFGDYGLVSVVLFTVRQSRIEVESWSLSCRALGRGIEHRILARLGEMAMERRLEFIHVPFIPSGKNQPAHDFLEGVAARLIKPMDEERKATSARHPQHGASPSAYLFPAAQLAQLRYNADAEPTSLLRSATAPDDDRESRQGPAQSLEALRRIAEEWRQVENLLPAIEASKRRGRPLPDSDFIAPTNEVERAVARIWQDVLGIEQVGRNDPFFELGGTSLEAVLVISELKKQLDVDISTVSLFEKATISSMVKMLTSQNEKEWDDKVAARRERGRERRNLARARWRGKRAPQ